VPVPAIEGLKVLPDTPLPLKVPPAGEPESVTEPAPTQTGDKLEMVTIGRAFTVIDVVAEFEQLLASEYV